MHVLVRDLDALADRTDRMPDLESEIPERIEDAVHNLGEVWQCLAESHYLARVEEHDIDVAVRIQFGAAVSAQSDQGQRGEFLLRLL